MSPGYWSCRYLVELLIRGWEISSSGAAGPQRWPEGQLSPRADSMSTSQPSICQWGWSFHTLRGGIDPRDLHCRPRVVRFVDILKNFLCGDEILSSPGAAGPRRCPEGQLSPRVLRASANQQPASGLGFQHRAGRYRPVGSPFLSRSRRNCRCMEAFWVRGWNPIFSGMRWRYIRTPPNQRSAGGAGVTTPCGAVSTRGHSVFVPRLLEL